MRIWAIELRRSALVWAIVPVTIAWVWLSFSRSFMWLGAWPAATAWATAPVSYAAIVLGALVAAEAARRRASAPSAALRMSRRGWVAVGFHLTAGLFLSLVPMAGALVAVTVRNAGAAPAGHLWGSYVTFAAAIAIASLCAAHLVGFAVPSVPIGALAGAAVGFIATAYAEIPLSAPPELQISTTRLIVAVGIAILSLVLAVFVPAWVMTTKSNRARSGSRVVAAVAALGCTLAVIVSPAAGAVQVPRPAPFSPACSTTTPRVCVWPEHSEYLPKLAPIAERIAQAADGLLAVPDEFLQEGLATADDANNGFTWLALDAGLWNASGGMASTVLNTTYMPRNCWPQTDADWDQRRDLNSQLLYWLTARGVGTGRPLDYRGDFQDTTAAQDALTLDEAAQKEWAAGIVRQVEDVPCVIQKSDQ